MIKFSDVGYFSAGTTVNEDTGFMENATFNPIPCRINYGFSNIVNNEGQEVISQAKIYLPASFPVDINYKFKYNSTDKDYKIQAVEHKKDVKGITQHKVVYI